MADFIFLFFQMYLFAHGGLVGRVLTFKFGMFMGSPLTFGVPSTGCLKKIDTLQDTTHGNFEGPQLPA